MKNQMKTCTKCGVEKGLEEFSFRTERGYYQTRCKLCVASDSRGRYQLHKEEYYHKSKRYFDLHKEKILLYNRAYRIKDKIKWDKYFKDYANKNKEKIRKKRKEYSVANKEKLRLYRIEYNHKNKAKISLRHKFRMETDINYKITCLLRTRINNVIKNHSKVGSAVKDLGCSIEEFKNYIAVKFQPGMTWANRGRKTWHLDHIKPLASFNLENREEFVVAVHYTNYQPLWATTAIARGHGDMISIGNLEKGDKILEVTI